MLVFLVVLILFHKRVDINHHLTKNHLKFWSLFLEYNKCDIKYTFALMKHYYDKLYMNVV